MIQNSAIKAFFTFMLVLWTGVFITAKKGSGTWAL